MTRMPRFAASDIRRLLRPLLIVVATLLIVGAFGLVAVVEPDLINRPLTLFPGPAGYTTFLDPDNGWTLRYPENWHGQPFSEEEGGGYVNIRQGIIVSNVERHFEWESGDHIIWSPRFDMNGFPADGVALQVMKAHGGRGFSIFCRYDTPPPLSLKDAKPADSDAVDSDGNPLKALGMRFVYKGLPHYSVTAWIGSAASPADVATLHEIVGSISYEEIGDPLYGQEDCLDR